MKNSYTSFELMKIFNISRGSWSKLKNKLNLDDYGSRILQGKKEKIIYNSQAYEILSDYYNVKKIENNNSFENNSLLLVKVQAKQIEELKENCNIFRKYYEDEKEKKEDLLVLTSELKSQLNNLNDDYNNILKENEKIKNLSLFKRIFKIY